jgi:hypothetical protein
MNFAHNYHTREYKTTHHDVEADRKPFFQDKWLFSDPGNAHGGNHGS